MSLASDSALCSLAVAHQLKEISLAAPHEVCVVCGNSESVLRGLRCGPDKGCHLVCSRCITEHVQRTSTRQDFTGQVFCPAANSINGCRSKAYSDAHLATKVQLATFESLNQKRLQARERVMQRTFNGRLEEQKRKAEEVQAKQRAEGHIKIEKLKLDNRLMPSHWQRKYAEQSIDGFALLPIDQRNQPTVWQALEQLLRTDPSQLGKGRDAKGGSYNRLQLATAWRFEHPNLWGAYMAGQHKVVQQMKHITNTSKLRRPHTLKLETGDAAGFVRSRAAWHAVLHPRSQGTSWKSFTEKASLPPLCGLPTHSLTSAP